MNKRNEATLRQGFIAQIWTTLSRPSTRSRLAALVTAGCIVGLPFSGAYFQSVSAQPRINLDNGAELRTLYANSEDVAEGKRLAESSCAGCHGANGISASPGVPHLAGQRPAYLYLELKAYQAGARGASAMNNAVRVLSDDALFKVAAYFASLDPPQNSATSDATAAASDPIEAGKTAAAGCAGCHGETGVSKTPGTPSLVGLDPKYLVAAMKAYKSGQRKNDLMKSMLATVTDANVNNIALYYALQKPARARNPRRRRQGCGHGGGGRLCGMPRRRWRERKSRDSEPCRAGCGVSRNRASGLQAGNTQR